MQKYSSNIENEPEIQRNFVIKRTNSVSKQTELVQNNSMQKLSEIVLKRVQSVFVQLPEQDEIHNIYDSSNNVSFTATPSLTPQPSPTKSTHASSFIKHPGTGHEDDWIFRGNLDDIHYLPHDADEGNIFTSADNEIVLEMIPEKLKENAVTMHAYYKDFEALVALEAEP